MGGEATLNNTRLRYRLVLARKPNDLGYDDLVVKQEHLEKIKSEDDQWIRDYLPKEAKIFWQTQKAGGSKKPFIQTENQNEKPTIKIRQDGKPGGKATPANAVSQTVLGSVNTVDFPHVFAAREEMRKWKFLQLNPEYLREPTPQDVGMRDTMTSGGKNMAAALYRIKQADAYSLHEISRKVNRFLPNFTNVFVEDDKKNRQFIIKLKGEDGKEFSSRVLSEGTLRLLALCILEFDDRHTGLLCYEEPENGIHPFRMEAMALLLKDLTTDFKDTDTPLRQVIVNTHSPALISQMLQWQKDSHVSVWLSRLNSLITDLNGNRMKLKITRMSPVLKESKPVRMSLESFPKSEIRLTLAEVKKYLETEDMENAIGAIK